MGEEITNRSERQRTTSHQKDCRRSNPDNQVAVPLFHPPSPQRPLVNMESYMQLPTITGRMALFRVSPLWQHLWELNKYLPSLGASEITFLIPRLPDDGLHDSSSRWSRGRVGEGLPGDQYISEAWDWSQRNPSNLPVSAPSDRWTYSLVKIDIKYGSLMGSQWPWKSTFHCLQEKKVCSNLQNPQKPTLIRSYWISWVPSTLQPRVTCKCNEDFRGKN